MEEERFEPLVPRETFDRRILRERAQEFESLSIHRRICLTSAFHGCRRKDPALVYCPRSRSDIQADPQECSRAHRLAATSQCRSPLQAHGLGALAGIGQVARGVQLAHALRFRYTSGVLPNPDRGIPNEIYPDLHRKRLAVIELAAAEGVRTYVNPQIVWASADMTQHEEGSVSMPGVTEEIERHARVRMSYQDLSGVEMVEEADGLLSVCLQHEVDQLDGIFWIYRLSRLKRDRVVKRFDKTQRTQAPAD